MGYNQPGRRHTEVRVERALSQIKYSACLSVCVYFSISISVSYYISTHFLVDRYFCFTSVFFNYYCVSFVFLIGVFVLN